jgi:thiamine biosynthesis lipoprotein
MEYSYDKHKLKWWHAPLLVILFVGTYFAMTGEGGRQAVSLDNTTKPWAQKCVQKAEGMVFGTFYHITYQSDKKLDDSIKVTLEKVDESLSPFNPKSTITAINENTDMVADEMFCDVFKLAKAVSATTNGAFDITVAPLVNLWGFGFKNMENVNGEKVDSLMKFVGIDKVSLHEDRVVKLMPEVMLDCSAIAKGYGVDAVGKMLERQGVRSYMVEIGGEVRLRGCNPYGKKWSIGITKPEDDSLNSNSDLEQVLSVTDIALATSGNYRNFYVKDGQKFAHTIDPRTGYPVQQNILSATVLAKDCATADAFATAFMVLGLDSARMVLEKDTSMMAFFIYATKDGTAEWASPKLKAMLKDPQ